MKETADYQILKTLWFQRCLFKQKLI